MISNYLCAYHVKRMQVCEQDAFHSWSNMMNRGVKAYVECRTEAANIYLNSALDIALLRASSEDNEIFHGLNVIKPAEFLIELCLLENAFEQASRLLLRMSLVDVSADTALKAEVLSFFAQQYERIEIAEKVFLGQSQQSTSTFTVNQYPLQH